MNYAQFFDPLFILNTIGLYGTIAVIFIESGIFFGFIFPGDSLLFTAGLVASQGHLSFPILFFGTFLAAAGGGAFGYFFGKTVGPSLFSRPDSLFFRKKHLDTTKKFFETYGVKTIILARFIPIVRTFAPILAGVGSMDFKVFLTFNTLGAAIWAFGATGLGYYLGRVVPNIEHFIVPILILIIATSFAPSIYEFVKHRRRRG